MERVKWIIGDLFSGLLKLQYTNEKIWFVLWVFYKGDPLNTGFMDPWIVDKLDIYHPIYFNNNQCNKL